MIKVSEWIKANCESHAIQDDNKLRPLFKEQTGHEAPWGIHNKTQTEAAIKRRGLGGTVNASDDDKLCYGYEVAYSCAVKFAVFHSQKMGRGYMFDDCVDALERAGL